MRTAFLALGIVALTGARGIQAQSGDGAAGYVSMILTPVAAVSPVVLPYMTGTEQQGVGFAVKYGRMSLGDIGSTNTFLADLTHTAGQRSWGLEAGYMGTTCQGCSGTVMLGAHVEGPLAALGSKTGSLFTLGIQATVGFAAPTNGTAMAVGLTVPIALSKAVGRIDIVPFVTPGVGFGVVTANEFANVGARLHVGGGVGVANVAPGLEITASAEKVFIEGGRTVFGLGMSWIPSR